MKRMTKTPDTADSANAARTAQARFTSWSRENERSGSIDDSPAMVAQRKKLDSLFGGAIQRVEEEEPLQGKFETLQRVEEEEPLQGKFEGVQRVEEEEPLQGKFETAQRVEEEEPLQGRFEAVQRVEEEEPLQGKFEAASSVQLKEEAAKPNNTGLPDKLKSGIESLSGMSMDNVKVHYNSSQPAQLNALAYAQGTDIHVAPGQEQHLPHEAWHVVQQAQGRVKPTMQMKEGVPVNDDHSLEHEADVMGAKAVAAGVLPAQFKEIQSTQWITGLNYDSSNSPAQLVNETDRLLEEANEQFEDEEGAYDDIEEELWSDLDNVIEYAETQLELCGYTNWDGTDSNHGDYCRFIWIFDYGVIVGVNVHYTPGKVAGNMYIKHVPGFFQPTPQTMVGNAPDVRPPTTMPWP